MSELPTITLQKFDKIIFRDVSSKQLSVIVSSITKMLNNPHGLPNTGSNVNIPGVPNVSPNLGYQNGMQGQQPASIGVAQSPQNGMGNPDPSLAFVNAILLPCARAVAKRLPGLQRGGINITEKVVLENIFLPEFQSLSGSIRSLPASGIRAPKTKSRPLAPGVVLNQVPGFTKLFYPVTGQETKCWWRYTRGNNPGIQCVKTVGAHEIYCDQCYNQKKTAQKHYDSARKMARGVPIRDYLFSLRGGAPPVASNPQRAASSSVPQPSNSGNITVTQYPGPKGLLYRSPEGVIYAARAAGIMAIGIDRNNKENGWLILPITPEYQGLVNQGVKVDDSLARAYAIRGGLPATSLDKSRQLINNSPAVANSAPTIPQTTPNPVPVSGTIPQGIPGTLPQTFPQTQPQGIQGTATQPAVPNPVSGTIPGATQPAVFGTIPGATQPAVFGAIPGATQPAVSQGIPAVSQGIPGTIPGTIPDATQPAVSQGIPGTIPGVTQPAVSQGIPGTIPGAIQQTAPQPTIPQGISETAPQPTIPQVIPGTTKQAAPQPTIPEIVSEPVASQSIAPINADVSPVPSGSSLPGAQATPLVGLTPAN